MSRASAALQAAPRRGRASRPARGVKGTYGQKRVPKPGPHTFRIRLLFRIGDFGQGTMLDDPRPRRPDARVWVRVALRQRLPPFPKGPAPFDRHQARLAHRVDAEKSRGAPRSTSAVIFPGHQVLKTILPTPRSTASGQAIPEARNDVGSENQLTLVLEFNPLHVTHDRRRRAESAEQPGPRGGVERAPRVHPTTRLHLVAR
jgi:hypothetical protein